MLIALIAWFVALACMAVSLRRLLRIAALATSAQRAVGELRAERPTPGGGTPLVRAELGDVLDAPSRAHAIASLNERLADVSRELEVGAQLPSSAARIALSAGTALALIEIARTLSGRINVDAALAAFAAGVTGGLVSGELGRRARGRAKACREGWDTLASLVLGQKPG